MFKAIDGLSLDALRVFESAARQLSFTAAASENSDSPTAERGGALDWMPLSNLPPVLAQQLLALAKQLIL